VAPSTNIGDKNTACLAESGELYAREKHRGNNQGPHRKRKVTPEQERQIRELYAVTKNGYKVAERLGLGSTTVYKWLNLRRHTRPRWSDEEIQVLVDGYLEKRTVKDIAMKVGRSCSAVRIKMCRYRKQVRADPKKQRALRAITMALRAVRKADIFREAEV